MTFCRKAKKLIANALRLKDALTYKKVDTAQAVDFIIVNAAIRCCRMPL